MKYLPIILLLYIGCTARQTSEERKTVPAARSSAVPSASLPILRALSNNHFTLQNLLASGTITLRAGKSSQTGSFDLKSKRLSGTIRSDSLSMNITGPFGISVAKFLGSANEYQFYNALEGDSYRGKPDPKTIEKLTGIKGLSIEALNNVLYGLPPSLIDTSLDIPLYRISASENLLLVHRKDMPMTEALYLTVRQVGTDNLPSVRLKEYRRWNRIVVADELPKIDPDIYISYSPTSVSGVFTIPDRIEVIAGGTAFEIEYRSVTPNTNPIVKIKMPQ
jgi:hypothetical protein